MRISEPIDHPDVECIQDTGYPRRMRGIRDDRPICDECGREIAGEWVSIQGMFFCPSCIRLNTEYGDEQ